MTIAVEGAASGTGSTPFSRPNSWTQALTTSGANRIGLLFFEMEDNEFGLAGNLSITSVTDGTNTWQRLTAQNWGTYDGTMEVWWAPIATASTYTLTITSSLNSSSTGPDNACWTVLAVSGLATGSPPVDSNGGLPVYNDNATTSPNVTIGGTYSTSQANDVVFSFVACAATTGQGSAPSGYTLDGDQGNFNGNTPNSCSVAHLIVSSSQSSQTVNWPTQRPNWGNLIIAFTADTSGETGTISQALKGISQAATGHYGDDIKMHLAGLAQAAVAVIYPPNSIGQALYGISQNLSGTFGEPVTGTVAQALHPIGQSAFGSLRPPGAIRQALYGLSQVAVGWMSDAGTISQALGGVSQSLAGTDSTSGTITQALGHLGQGLAGLQTQDVTGTVTQALGGIKLSAVGSLLSAAGNGAWWGWWSRSDYQAETGNPGITPTAPPAALTRTNDTNVTVTLGGSPTTALVNPASLTLGWSGTLAVARGGTGGSTASGTLLDNITGFSSTGFLKRTGAGTYAFVTDPSDVTSVFTRTGAVVATSGDYTVSQVTGAAPLASPVLTGTPTAPTAAAGTSTTQVATTAFVQSAGLYWALVAGGFP